MEVMGKESLIIENEMKEVMEFINSVFTYDLAILKEIVNQVLTRGGKRIRPTLVLLTADIFDGITRDATLAASIIEVVHAASLLHDDVVDGSPQRRGAESLNARFNNKVSVLLGDFLFTKAYARLSRIHDQKVTAALADAAAHMSLGQLVEAYFQGDGEITREEYFSVIGGKTASLFSTCCRIGALIGHAPEEQVELMARFGKNYGLAFQITDDCLDYWGDEKLLGKPVGSDLIEKKYTLPVIHLLEEGGKEDQHLVREIFSMASPGREHIKQILSLMEKHRTREFAYGIAREFGERALAELSGVAPCRARVALEKMVRDIITRDR
ncbi:MAG: polyprenyl synthetase family protein [Candidatus Eremiobacteraeota bacterium]|nr:polyprenyl synthetase family protein [Candidatus Eremiobacteraeota bacterium]